MFSELFAFSALARLSARARHSRCPTEFGELSRVAYLSNDPGLRCNAD